MNRFNWLLQCVGVGASIFASSNGFAQFGGAAPSSDGEKPKAGEERSVLVPGELRDGGMNTQAAFCRCVGEDDSESIRRIEQALRAPLKSTGLTLNDAPLFEVAALVSNDYGIPVLLDEKALGDIGISKEEPVSVDVHNISLRSAMRLMLKTHNLTYIVRDEVLLITTPEEAEKQLITCVYGVRDLANDEKTLSSLADAITACVHSETWTKNNSSGTGEIRALKPGLLVVSQTPAVHEEIRGLLEAIRGVLAKPAAASTQSSGATFQQAEPTFAR